MFTEIEVSKSLRYQGFPTGTIFTYKGNTLKVYKNQLVRMNGKPFQWEQPHG